MNQMTFGLSSDLTARPASPRGLAKAATRARLVASARALFLERGYEATTVRDIALSADRSIGAVFNCFSDKLDLLEAVMADEAAALGDAARTVIRRNPGFADTIHHLHDLLVAPAAARLVLIERHLPASRRHLQPALRAAIADAAIAARGRGQIAPRLQPDLVCGLIWDLLTARCQDVLDRDVDPGAVAAITNDRLDLLMAALTP